MELEVCNSFADPLMRTGAKDATSNNRNRRYGTIADLLHGQANENADAACILTASAEVLTWARLARQIDHTRVTMRRMGLGPDDRVAVVMPNGPLLAVAFLSIASASACAPLNPSYGIEEFEFYLGDLNPSALVVAAEAPPAAREAARRLGIPILEAVPDSQAPGLFDLHGEPIGETAVVGTAIEQGIALLLHTSGTTSRPKLVPLRHRNLTVSAHNIVEWLKLTATDRCLNLMPLFHIHGLVGGLLAPLAAGGSVVCAPTFRPNVFHQWHDATHPTWYTAVPTIHRAIAVEAAGKDFGRSSIRFIRSSSSPLPSGLFEELVNIFDVPVVEAYSMTEASHQMTCNPVEAGRQKPGTVGLPAGPEVGLLDANNEIHFAEKAGEIGEIVIRGPSVMEGYLANPDANAQAFINGWFRTGDLGQFDADGYLTLTGRIKEQINRGGEKISPFEVDQALLRHPEVIEAVAFGFEHPTLGEEIAAAVVLRPQARVTADELRTFLRSSVAPFKMPKRILLLDKIPKGPTGKVQRRQLAKSLQFDSQSSPSAEPPEATGSELEAALLALWRRVIGRDSIGPDDDFFESGGDSLMALEVILKLEEMTNLHLRESLLLDHPTIRQLMRGIADMEEKRADPLVPVQVNGSRPPLFFFHGDYGGGYYTRRIARLIGPDQPFYSIAPHDPGSALRTIEEMAADRLPAILKAHPTGPFLLAGYCNGGIVAYEVARLLEKAGRRVDLIAMIDTPPLNFRPSMQAVLRVVAATVKGIDSENEKSGLARGADFLWRQMCNLQQSSISGYAGDVFGGLLRRLRVVLIGSAEKASVGRDAANPGRRLHDELIKRDVINSKLYNRAFRRYIPAVTNLSIVYYSAIYRRAALRNLGPKSKFVSVPGGHWGCVTTHAEFLAENLHERLDEVTRSSAR